MSIYYDEINRRAIDSWNGPWYDGKPKITKDNFEQWKDHWLQTTLDWADECRQSGYKLTYHHVMNIYKLNK